MKLIVHFPLLSDREYLDDFEEDTIPNIGDDFGEIYVVSKKEIRGNICELSLRRNSKL